MPRVTKQEDDQVVAAAPEEVAAAPDAADPEEDEVKRRRQVSSSLVLAIYTDCAKRGMSHRQFLNELMAKAGYSSPRQAQQRFNRLSSFLKKRYASQVAPLLGSPRLPGTREGLTKTYPGIIQDTPKF